MGIGGSIALIAIGAIITFALDVQVGFLDLDVVGWVMMAAGLVGLVLILTVFNRRRTVTSTTGVAQPGVVRQDTYDDGPMDPRI